MIKSSVQIERLLSLFTTLARQGLNGFNCVSFRYFSAMRTCYAWKYIKTQICIYVSTAFLKLIYVYLVKQIIQKYLLQRKLLLTAIFPSLLFKLD